MNMFQPDTRIDRAIADGAQAWNAATLAHILEVAKRYKPDPGAIYSMPAMGAATGYDALSVKRQHYYEGKTLGYLRSLLGKHYPNTHERMRVLAFNLVKLIGEQDSDVYRDKPKRVVHTQGGVVDEKATAEAGRAYDEIKAFRVLAEGERRRAIADDIFVRASISPLTGKLNLSSWWPHNVDVIPDHREPSSLQHAHALIARCAGPTLDEQWYEVWTRADGSPWSVALLSASGASAEVVPGGVWGDVLPWAVWLGGEPSSACFSSGDGGALLSVQDSINLAWIEVDHMIRMQAHSQGYTSGGDMGDLVGGPGTWWRFAAGTQVGVLDFDPKIVDTLAAIEAQLGTLARQRRQSPSAYRIALDGGNTQSGVARKIDNMPQEEARRERVAWAEHLEEQLFAIVGDLWRRAGHGGSLVGKALVFQPSSSPDLEDATERQDRAASALSLGLIDRARAAVESGWYATTEEARAAFDAMDEQRRQVVEAAGYSGVGKRLEALRELGVNVIGGLRQIQDPTTPATPTARASKNE